MKRIANYLIAMALIAFTFTSCEDVPTPFGITPPGEDDATVTIEPAGSGTLADPYNVQSIIDLISSQDADTPLARELYVKGIVTNIPEGSAGISASYNNATFYISDDADGNNSFYIFRCKGLGGGDITDEGFLKVGDEVVIYGTSWVNYKGNTPETSQGAAYIYSINGSTEGGEKPDTPTDTKVVTIAEFNAAEVSTDVWYQLTGTVKNLKDGDKYGNFDIEDATGSVYVYGLLSEKGGEKQKFQELATAKGIKEGSKITIIGNRGAYNEKIEVVNAYFVSVEGGSEEPSTGGAKGSGTLADPYNVEAITEIASKLDKGQTSTDDYYFKGKISTVKYTFDAQHGTATFFISDDGTTTGEFQVYSALYLENKNWQDGDTQIKVGDEVIIYGKVTNYNGTLETASKKAYIYSLNGKTQEGGSSASNGSGTQNDPYTVAGIIEVASKLDKGQTSTDDYYFKGKISTVKYTFDAQHGTATFFVSDDGTTNTEFQAYSVLYLGNKNWQDGDTQIKVGDEVIIFGKVTNYNGTLETASKKAYIYSLNGKTN